MKTTFHSMPATVACRLALAVLLGLAVSLSSVWATPPDKTLHIVGPWEVGSLDPSKTGYIFTRLQVTETLVAVDAQGGLVPGLAAAWDVSGNQLSWRFRLRAGARFHDGTPVTAQDVVRALERARKNPGVLGLMPLQAMRADKDAVVFELSRPFTPLPAFLAQYSTQILAPASFAADGSVTSVIGSGPYQVSQVQAPQKVETVRFAGWQGPVPAVEKVSYLAVGRGENRNLLASSGQADLVFTHDPANFASLRANRRLQFHTQPIPRTIYLKLNAALPALRDVATRRAISLALDRTGMASAILHEPKAAATQLFPPTMGEWHVPGMQPLLRGPDEARALLKSAGWTPGPDGVLQREGQPFKVTLRTYPDRPELPVLAAAIQAQLRAVGIDMAVSVSNSSDVPAGHKDGTLEMALVARNYALVPDPVGTLLQDFGPSGGDWGAMHWSSPALRDAIDALSGTSDSQRRSRQRGTIATLLQAELPLIPVAWYQQTATSSTRLQNASIDPLEISFRITQLQWAR